MPKVVTQRCLEHDLNPRPTDRKPKCLTRCTAAPPTDTLPRLIYRDASVGTCGVCSACDCDPIGSEHGGECESRTDAVHDLVAGRCICKRLVVGRRCDTCMDGYWNMRADNPDGCEGRPLLLCFFFGGGATVCKTVRPMLSVRCLSCPVCLSCLSVTLVYCGC